MIPSAILLPIHLLSLAITFVGIVLADHQGFNWMHGKEITLDEKKVRRYHHWVSYGLVAMIVTGGLLAYPAFKFLLTRPAFYFKMLFVSMLIINAFVINSLMKVALTRPFSTLAMSEKLPLLISGAISTFGWLGAFACAFFLFPD